MKGKKVRIQLFTPVNLEISDPAGKAKSSNETLFRLHGRIAEWFDAGIEVEGQEFFNQRGNKIPLPSCRLFLPFHKIDHILED